MVRGVKVKFLDVGKIHIQIQMVNRLEGDGHCYYGKYTEPFRFYRGFDFDSVEKIQQ